MNKPAIRVMKLGKEYRIGARQAAYKTMRDTLTEMVTLPARRVAQLVRGASAADTQREDRLWALKDVSFDVQPGEVVGIIGRNGAGKSTLLKILSEITEPSAGRVEIYGRVGALLEVGTGFHQELTGRENIYLNGAILGMLRSEIARKFDEIVDFAEIERFVDTPVKHYSSGMHLRLGFAVAAHLEPEILIVDEVLAVGDAAFQKKCMGKMGDVARAGRTILLVSHNMGAIQGLCERSIWLERGSLVDMGRTSEIVTQYLRHLSQGQTVFGANSPITVETVRMRKADGEATNSYQMTEDIELEIGYHAKARYEKPVLIAVLHSIKTGGVIAANSLLDGRMPAALEGRGTLRLRFLKPTLLPQSYFITLDIRSADNRDTLFPNQEIASFEVIGKMADYGFINERADYFAQDSYPLVAPYEWIYDDHTVERVELALTTQAHDER